jgi:hypothetical protein
MARKPGKRRNGEGEGISIHFDQSDPQERRALTMAKLLAGKHGRRKQAIVALLDAMYSHYEDTGELLTATAIQNAIMAPNAGRSSMGSVAAVSQMHNAELPRLSAPAFPLHQPGSHQGVSDAGVRAIVTSGGKANAKQTTQNFINSMSSMSFFD